MTRAAVGAPLVVALIAVSAVGVARTRPRLAHVVHDVKEQDDVPDLPPPSEIKTFAFGYDAATVDLLWAKMLVAYGAHWHEKRDFHPDPYMEAILAIEPTYAPVYRFADTLLCYRPMHATEADARKARAILQEGTRERPNDYMVWQEYGQFSAFLGPEFLPDSAAADRAEWRREAGPAVARAAELGADSSMSLAAAGILERSGERDAQIKVLENRYAITDDPEQQAIILQNLQRLQASAGAEATDRARKIFDARRDSDWPFLSRDQFLLLGPAPDAARCAGLGAMNDPACASDWGTVLGAP